MKTAVDNSRSIESQTAIVWREFRRRRGAVIALWVIAAIVTIAIWAPFLANDRPFWYRGYERFEYGELMRTARTLVAQAIPAALQSAPVDDPYGQNEMAAEATESTEVKAEIPTGWERTVVQSLQGMQDRVEEPFAETPALCSTE